MMKIFSGNGENYLPTVNKLEKDLKFFIAKHWANLFPNLLFIKTEFRLEGNVRSKNDSNGSIDIFAFNPETNRFVIIELKRKFDKNIRTQADDYRDFIEFNFSDIYLIVTDKLEIKLPSSSKVDKENTEIILVANEFTQTDIEKAMKSKQFLTLVRYEWFNDNLSIIENDFLVLDFINNQNIYCSSLYLKIEDDELLKEKQLVIFYNVLKKQMLDVKENKKLAISHLRKQFMVIESLLSDETKYTIEYCISFLQKKIYNDSFDSDINHSLKTLLTIEKTDSERELIKLKLNELIVLLDEER